MWCTVGMRSFRLALLAMAVVMLAACGDDPDEQSSTDVDGVVVEADQTNDHVDGDIDYDADPPSAGDHAPVWLNCDFYVTEVPTENAVHALEHGVVWLTHDPDLPEEDVAMLEELFDSRPDRIIVSPYPGLDAPVVAVAWERRLEADGTDDPRLPEFIDAFVNGAAAPEPRAPCEGGLGRAG